MNPRAAEILDKIISGETPNPGMWETCAVRLLSYERGKILMQACADGRHINAFGGVHGGYAARSTVVWRANSLSRLVNTANPSAVSITLAA